MKTKSEYRSLQQIAAKTLVEDMEALIDRVSRFGAMTSPVSADDSIGKLRRVQRRIAEHMHMDDRK